jgi:hypothetical protein
VGLLEYHALKQNPAVLELAKRLGNFLLRIGPSFNSTRMADAFSAEHFASSYICWIQDLSALYAVAKDVRYRDLCSDIVDRMQRRPADHVHSYLCSWHVVPLSTHLRRSASATGRIGMAGHYALRRHPHHRPSSRSLVT